MCLIALAIHCHPDFPLIIASNRDEFFERETKALHYWDDYPQVLAGKDLVAGGTWMGLTTTGKFSALTNFRELGNKKTDHSRGHLVSGFIQSNTKSIDYIANIKAQKHQFSGFNQLLSDDLKTMNFSFYSNRDDDVIHIKEGIFAISNGKFYSHWPKTETIKSGLKKLVSSVPINVESIFDLLNNEQRVEAGLPETGFPKEFEKKLSSIFIPTLKVQDKNYGTVSSNILLMTQEFKIHFIERRYNTSKEVFHEKEFILKLS